MKQLREKSGKRAEEIAAILALSVSTVRNWEQGKHEPRFPITEIPRFLEAYDCSLEDAIHATEESKRLFARNQKK